MKKILISANVLWLIGAITAGALTIANIEVTGATNASGPITVSATINGVVGQGYATFQTTSADGLSRRYFYPAPVSGTSWSNNEWNPYFTGTFIIEVVAFDYSGTPPITAATTVTVTRAVSGSVNAILYSALPYNPDGVWSNVDLNAVKLHDIGLSTDASGIGSVGCNLLNANPSVSPDASEEERDVAYTDTGNYKPAGTPYRFDVTLHARPRGFMGMGEIKRWIWIPADTNAPNSNGRLVADIASCSPWRSSYSNALQSHVGMAPLFAPPDADMPTGMIMCTSAHYMDVRPTNTTGGADNEGRAGLFVNGHTGTNSYLKMFLSDQFLQQQLQITNVYEATNLLAGFIQHFDTNGAPIDTAAEVTANFIRIEGGTNILYDYNSDGLGDTGFEMRFDFVFHSGVAAQMGMASTNQAYSALAADFDGDGLADPAAYTVNNTWMVWLSSGNYEQRGPFAFGTNSASPVAADFDGDGLADPAVYTANNTWFVWLSSGNYEQRGPFAFGTNSASPVAADFDGDGLADPAVYTANNTWFVWLSSGSYEPRGPFAFGTNSASPVAADFDGDGLADPAVYTADNTWFVWLSSGSYEPRGPFAFGAAGYQPVAADFDGDGLADPAIATSQGTWYIFLSSRGYNPSGPYPFVL